MNTKVTIAGVELKNPVMTASGTFGSGAEFSEFYDLGALGAVVTKGVANVPWPGNPTPRIAETRSGMLNAIGLQNPGIDVFVKRDIPFLKKYDTKIIVNVCGKSEEDYCEVVERLADEPVDMLEINVSCPNVKEGGIAFGQDPKALQHITEQVKKRAKQPVIMKLSPNVTDITVMAKAAEAGGADALSMINTLTGMKIDIHRRTFAIANKTGGMSGSCCEAGGCPDGLSDSPGGKYPDHRNGWYHQCGRCTGVYSGRSHGSICGNSEFCKSLCGERSGRRNRELYETVSGGGYPRPDRCCEIRRLQEDGTV